MARKRANKTQQSKGGVSDKPREISRRVGADVADQSGTSATNDLNVWFIVAALSVLGGCIFEEWQFGAGIGILLTCALNLNPKT
jgi:hypothetical protein